MRQKVDWYYCFATRIMWSMHLTIRTADATDAATIRQLAQLDSQPVPSGAMLLAEQDGVPVAAIAIADGRVLADPFHRTADVANVLGARAAQLRDSGSSAKRSRALRRRALLRTS